ARASHGSSFPRTRDFNIFFRFALRAFHPKTNATPAPQPTPHPSGESRRARRIRGFAKSQRGCRSREVRGTARRTRVIKAESRPSAGAEKTCPRTSGITRLAHDLAMMVGQLFLVPSDLAIELVGEHIDRRVEIRRGRVGVDCLVGD